MNRRELLKKAGLAMAGVPFWMGILPENLQAKIPSGIKITGLKTFMVGNYVFLKIYTNQGVTGLGEGTIHNQAQTVEAAIRDREHILIGRDPTNIEFLWQAMFRWPRYRDGKVPNAAISAIEIALWDILGKVLEVPIYKCLGGAARDRIRLYCHNHGRTPEAMAESVRKSVEEDGFTIVRTGLEWSTPIIKRPWNLKLAVSLIEAMREAAGDDVDIIDDAHGLMTPVMVVEYANAIEQYRLMFIEDPILAEDIAGLEWIGNHTNVPLGVGENNHTRFGYFRDMIFKHLVSYVRPDVIHAGGISECKKIGAMAEANFIDVALHVHSSPVSDLASAHIAATTPNCVCQEYAGHQQSQWIKDLFNGDDISITDGYAALPQKPGLGCDLNEEVAAKHPYVGRKMPQVTDVFTGAVYEDGTPKDH
ncbi:enolase C-terminal domain-like protein [Candidatus Latescibacterota bacterium]